MRRVAIPFLLFLLSLVFTMPARPATQAYPPSTILGRATIAIMGSERTLVNVPVVQGDKDSVVQLGQGLVHWEETPLPGQPGTAVFSGHRSFSPRPLAGLDEWPLSRTILRLYTRLPKRETQCYRLTSRRVVYGYSRNPGHVYRPGLVQTWACHPPGNASRKLVGYWWRINCADVG